MDTSELAKFLETATIPKIKKKPKTFLGIARQPHYENVLSNIYAFYFDTEEKHNLKDLFIKSLLALVKDSKFEKQADTFTGFCDYSCETECTTLNGGRIDLLLSNDSQAILIENKVYHTLNNDLYDYWKTVKLPDAHKIGIILSLSRVSDIKHSGFINISHLDFLRKVMENSGPYLLEAQDKYFVFLKDLYQNIINLSKSYMEEKDLKFYFDHQTEINQLAEFKFSVRRHIMSEVEKAGNTLDGLNLLTPRKNSELEKRVRYYVCPANRNLVIAVVFDGLLTPERGMHIAVELQGNALKDRSRYDEILFSQEEKEVLSNHMKTTNYDWTHFAVKYYNLDEKEIADLGNFILKKLKEDHLLSVYEKLKAFLIANK